MEHPTAWSSPSSLRTFDLNPPGNGCLHGLSRAPLPPICASPPRRRYRRRSTAGRRCPWSSPPLLGARIPTFPAPSEIASAVCNPPLAAALTAALNEF